MLPTNYLFINHTHTRIHTHTHTHINIYQPISITVRVLANAPGDRGSVPGRVIPKTQKMIVDATLFNTQHYKVRIKGKWSNPGNGVAPPLHLGVVAIAKGTFRSSSITVGQLIYKQDLELNNQKRLVSWLVGWI